MNKKIIAVFAAFSMIATASVGLVQTAYAAEASIRVEVADGAEENQKVLTYYYENIDGIMDAQFYLDVVEGVNINGVTITVSGQDNDCGVEFDEETQLPYAYYILSNGGKAIASEDGAFLTATITVPGDKDVTVTLTPDAFRDAAGTNYDIEPIEVTIPKKASEPEPVRVFNADQNAATSFSTAEGYDEDMVAAQFTLTIENGSYDLANATYNGNTSKNITAADGSDVASTVITGAPTAEAVVFVVLSGTSDLAELGNVVFE